MSDISSTAFPKFRPNPLFKNLPEYAKDKDNYWKIEKALIETLACSKSHSEVVDMTKCKKCTENMLVRRELMKTLGFKTPAVYMAWKKVMRHILGLVEKKPLV